MQTTLPRAYYAPSGKTARGALAIGCAYGLAVLPGAMLYAWVTMRAPAFVNVIALLIFGLWIAVVADLVALKARVRSQAWMRRFTLALALSAWYCHWAVWVALDLHGPDTGWLHRAAVMAIHPAALLAAAVHIAQHNAWGVATMPMVAVWLVEVAVLAQLAPGLGLVRVAQPFCEASGTWAEPVLVPRRFSWIDQPGAVAHLLEQAPEQLVSVLSAWPAQAERYAELTLYRCRGGDGYVSIWNMGTSAGKPKPRAVVVVALRLAGVRLDELIAKLIARADARIPASAVGEVRLSPELASSQALLQAAQFGDALARALPHTEAAQHGLRLEAHRLCALCCMHLARWLEACGHWQAVFDDEPAVQNALQLAGTCVMAGNLDQGHSWFHRARALNAATRELPPLSLLTNFVSALDHAGHPATAMPWLAEIRECYCQQGVTDPTILFANRMPLFNEFLDRSAPIVLAALGRQPGLRWFAAMLGRLDEPGNIELGQWLDEQERSLAG
jgi:hypothetical protein